MGGGWSTIALINAFGAIALDTSVIAATPLLKQINTTLLSTPAVYVVNPSTTVVNVAAATPVALQNVNVTNFATPYHIAVDSSALPVGASTEATVANRFGGGATPYAAVLNTPTTAIITPGLGQRVQILWVSFIPNSDNTSSNLVTVKFNTGVTMYIGYAMAHWELFTGTVNDSVIINLANNQPVATTVHYKLL